MAFAGRTRPNRSRPARGSLPPRPGEWHFPTRCSSPRRRFSLPPPMTSAPTSNPLPRQRPHVPHHAITLRRLPETPLRRARRPRTSTSRTLTKRTSRTVDRAEVDHADIPYRQPRERQTRKKGYRSSGIFMQPCNNQLAHEDRVVTATSSGLRRYNKEDDRIIIIIL